MRKLTLVGVIFLLAMAGCGGGDEEEPRAQGRRRASPSPEKPAICPLTAKPAPSGIDLERPALSVKIENAPESRPQSGLEEADIVYEQLAEGGITRFNAIFHCSDADQVGPIRSARFVDADILPEYRPVLFAYAGAARPVEEKVSNTQGVTDLSFGRNGKAYRRDSSKRAPHNLYSSTDQLRSISAAERVRGTPETGLQFDASSATPAPGARGATPSPGASPSPQAGTPPPPGGNEVSFSFGGRTPSRYTYDAASGAYSRFHGTQLHSSAGGEQLQAVNVVVLKVAVTPGTIKDAAGNLSPEITVIGNGEAIVLSGGRSVTGRWNRATPSAKTSITDASGGPVKLKPGNTWIHLVPITQAVTVR